MEFTPILILLILSSIIACLIPMATYFIGHKQPDIEKVSVYECGFDPFDNPGNPFPVKFFLIAILFLVFDIEISFMFLWAAGYMKLELSSYWVIILFLALLTLGLIYEWVEGGLEWEK